MPELTIDLHWQTPPEPFCVHCNGTGKVDDPLHRNVCFDCDGTGVPAGAPRIQTSPDACEHHKCPRCDVQMTNRECLTCKRKDGTPLSVRFCALCDGGPIVITREECASE